MLESVSRGKYYIANQDELEAGRIMMTQEGLSKSEMNRQLVELESQKNVGTESLRWQCCFLRSRRETPSNLRI